MVKLIHGADFHLDSPFSGLSPEQAALRRGEQRELLDRLANLARTEGADLVLLAGDLLDGERVYRETAQALARALGDIPCPVFIAPGNHDFYSPRSLYATLAWPDNVYIFTSDSLESVPLPQLNCTVHGRAFTGAHRAENPLSGFRANREDGRIHLMCLHGEVAPASDYGPITEGDIAASGLDYLALGHVHRASGLRRAGDTFWAWPGCPEGRGFDETGDKGVLVVEADRGHVQARFQPLCRRRYHRLEADVTGTDPLSAILSVLPAGAEADIVRIALTGEGNAPDLPALERSLKGRCYALTLTDLTRLPRDLWQRREEDSLTGLFLQTMWEKCQGQPDDRTLQLAVRFGLAALENGEDIAL